MNSLQKVILKNLIKCNHCLDIIESKTRHDFKSCSCGRVSVDGGLSYLKRSFILPDDYIDLSETYELKQTLYDRPETSSCSGCNNSTNILYKYTCKSCGRVLCGCCGQYCKDHREDGLLSELGYG